MRSTQYIAVASFTVAAAKASYCATLHIVGLGVGLSTSDNYVSEPMWGVASVAYPRVSVRFGPPHRKASPAISVSLTSLRRLGSRPSLRRTTLLHQTSLRHHGSSFFLRGDHVRSVRPLPQWRWETSDQPQAMRDDCMQLCVMPARSAHFRHVESMGSVVSWGCVRRIGEWNYRSIVFRDSGSVSFHQGKIEVVFSRSRFR